VDQEDQFCLYYQSLLVDLQVLLDQNLLFFQVGQMDLKDLEALHLQLFQVQVDLVTPSFPVLLFLLDHLERLVLLMVL